MKPPHRLGDQCRRMLLHLLLAVAGSGGAAVAQGPVQADFSGYLVNLPVFQAASKNFLGESHQLFLDLTRLRLRPTVHLGDHTRLAVEYEIDALYQSRPVLFVESVPSTSRQSADLRWNPVREDHVLVSHFIDRLYLRQEFGFGNVVVGRQRVAWGSGRVWNPTDLFSPINPASFDKIEKDGADLLSMTVYLGQFSDVTVVYNPHEHIRDNNAGMRLRSNLKGYDWSIVGGYFDERVVVGGDFTGNLFTAGLRGEGIISADRRQFRSRYLKYVLGLDYQFSPRFYGLVEYQHNGQGAAQKSGYDLAALLRGEIINLSQDYLFVQMSVQLHPLWNGGVGYNVNLNDGSAFVSLSINHSAGSNFDVTLGGQLFYGSRLDEYWFYPSSFYLRGQYHF